MSKIIIEPGRVFNMGGYIVEIEAKLPCRDLVLGNPTAEPVKINAPLYSAKYIKEYEKQGLIVHPVKGGESLRDALEKVRKQLKKG